MKISTKKAGVIFSFIMLAVLVYIIIPKTKETEKVEDKIVNTDNLDKIEFKVTTAKVFKGDLVKWVTANGMVKANRELEIQSNVGGFIKDINVFEGKKVNKGDLLLSIDDTEYQLRLKNAKAKVNSAIVEYKIRIGDSKGVSPEINTKQKEIEKKMEDLKKLLDSGKLSKEEYEVKNDDLSVELLMSGAKRDEVAADVSNLSTYRINVQQALIDLGYTKISAPFSGAIGEFNLIAQQRINAGTKLFKLFEISTLKVEVGVLENEVSSISIGNTVEVNINSLPGEKFFGKVVNISPHIDTETKTCKVIVEMQNKNDKIKPGMYASVNIQAATFKNRILAPKDALVVRDNRSLVFVVSDNLAKWEYIDLGEINDRYIEIKGGNVKVGDEVVIKNHTNLAHDAKVKVVERK